MGKVHFSSRICIVRWRIPLCCSGFRYEPAEEERSRRGRFFFLRRYGKKEISPWDDGISGHQTSAHFAFFLPKNLPGEDRRIETKVRNFLLHRIIALKKRKIPIFVDVRAGQKYRPINWLFCDE